MMPLNSAASSIDAVYLGWLPIDPVGDSTEPVLAALSQLMTSGSSVRSAAQRRHCLQISAGRSGCLAVMEFSSNGRRQTLLPFADIDWVGIHPRDSLAFGIVLNGYIEESNNVMHLHAWRSLSVAQPVGSFAANLAAAAEAADIEETKSSQQQQHEQQQAKGGHHKMPSDRYCFHRHETDVNSGTEAARYVSGHSQSNATASSQPNPNLGSLAHELAHEFQHRLDDCSNGAPLLHPPKDYDTLRRSHGNPRYWRSELTLAGSSQAPNGAYIRRKSVVRLSDLPDEPQPDYDLDELDPSSAASSAAPPSPMPSGGGSSGRRDAESARAMQDDEEELNVAAVKPANAKFTDSWVGFSAWRS